MKHENGCAEVWTETVVIPTYGVGKPDRNPMFLEKRVYQGSSGKVYPLPVIDKIEDEKKDASYNAVFLENDYLKVMILPELGGRIQRAYDKTTGYDFVYYNDVIKPALVGLTGPWISGGIEFNWPQHHRPTTFSPVDCRTQHNADGSCTVQCSEVDQMYGTKGEMSFTLYPDKAYIEIKGRLYNRTNLPQTFLWWANPAVPVNDHTQSIFPPDVHAVFDHGKRDVSKFPIATGVYYKYDYGRGVDISRYKNIPVPTSYMCYKSDYNFVGGYDYEQKEGILHVADHHISPGKKQWTWGCGDFGQAWDRNLTDHCGPYIELMTGVYTDNQPDFTWLKPFEEKTFTQIFMPYKNAGMVKNANTEVVLNLEKNGADASVTVYATSVYQNAHVVLSKDNERLIDEQCTISPVDVYENHVQAPEDMTQLTLEVFDSTGRLMLSYTPEQQKIEEIPEAMKPAKEPTEIMTVEELYLTGLHIEQYRHATYEPDSYYLEALRRDPGDIRTNNAYGTLLLRRGQFKQSEPYFRKALERMTWKNPNPYDSEAYYSLGLSLWYQGRMDEAYDAFYKSTWTAAQEEMGYYYLASIASQRHDYATALDHIERSLVKNWHNLKARALKAKLLIVLGRNEEAAAWLNENLKLDSFDYDSRFILAKINPDSSTLKETLKLMNQRESSFIECALDFEDAGFYREAAEILELQSVKKPMTYYHLAWAVSHYDHEQSMKYLAEACKCDPIYCFPNKLEDIIVLEYAIKENSEDGYAPYYLGCLEYDRRQYDKAINLWQYSEKLIPDYPTVHRNLAIACFNKQDNRSLARQEMETAFKCNPDDARVFQELDQLYHKIGMSVRDRRKHFDEYPDLWPTRDELYVEYVTLLNLQGEYKKAYDLIMAHQFHPWEGGEGKVTAQYMISLVQLARVQLKNNHPLEAKHLLVEALTFPHNLGEGKLIIAKDNNIHYYLGLAEKAMGDFKEAEKQLKMAADGDEEPAGMMYYNDQPADLILYEGLANLELGNGDRARARFHKLIDYGEKHYYDHVKIDYFAVSLPDLQLFDEDLSVRNRAHCAYLIALGNYGLNNLSISEEYYQKTLAIDCAHQGAVIHEHLVKEAMGLKEE